MPGSIDQPADGEVRRQAEIDAAWEQYRKGDVLAAASSRRDWLLDRFERQNGRCAYCGVPMTLETIASDPGRRATLDHVVARSRGGPDEKPNTVAACAYCNAAKASTSEAFFRRSPVLRQRRLDVNRVPDRLSNDPASPHYDALALERGVRVVLNGKERTGVVELCQSAGWIRQRTPSRDRRGQPLVLLLKGKVDATFRDALDPEAR